MGGIMDIIKFLGIHGTIAVVIVTLLFIMQIIGELVELSGKVVPEFLKVRKYFKRKKKERQEQANAFKEMQQLLNDMKSHYSADNIAKRNMWINDVNTDRDWTHQKADVYDKSIMNISNSLLEVANQLRENTKMTEDMFVENSRDRIIDFAERASDNEMVLSHEQFRRIFRVYEDYEKFLEEHKRTNGEVDTAYEMIQDGFKYRIKNHCFAEDLLGYPKRNTTQND